MEASTVYYTDFRCPVGTSLTEKLRRLCLAAGIKNIDMDGKFVAIKMHFGELGNLAFLRPNYAKVVADLCKEQGGLPVPDRLQHPLPGQPQKRAGAPDLRPEQRLLAHDHGLPDPDRRRPAAAPMRSKCRCPTASTARRPRSAAPSWTPMSSSA